MSYFIDGNGPFLELRDLIFRSRWFQVIFDFLITIYMASRAGTDVFILATVWENGSFDIVLDIVKRAYIFVSIVGSCLELWILIGNGNL